MARPVKDRKPGSLDPNLYAPWWTRPGYKPPAPIRPPEQGPRPIKPTRLPEGHGYRKDPRTLDPTRDRTKKILKDQLNEDRFRKKAGDLVMTLLEESPTVKIGDLIDGLIVKVKKPGDLVPITGGWSPVLACYNDPINWQYQSGGGDNPFAAANVTRCRNRQAGGEPLGTAILSGNNNLILAHRYPVSTSFRWRSVQTYARPASTGATEIGSPTGWAPMPGILQNPNVLRWATAAASAAPGPTLQPPAPAPATATPVQIIVQSSGAPRLPTGQPFATRSPPGPGKREGKTLSRNAKIGITLYKILDQISEGCEVVDAFFSALPGNTQIRWSRNRDGRLADNAGQYGLDGCDWKLQALYHNWHQVNFDTAVRNMIANQLQDRVIGDIQKILPNNTGQALEGGEMALNQILDAIFKGSGLTK